jgi:hypothetical protein
MPDLSILTIMWTSPEAGFAKKRRGGFVLLTSSGRGKSLELSPPRSPPTWYGVRHVSPPLFSPTILFVEAPMITLQRLQQLFFSLAVAGAALSCSPRAVAALITIEPDNYAQGTDLNTIEPGLLLHVYNSILGDLEPHAITDIDSWTDVHSSTGIRVFAHNEVPYFSDVRQLNITFAAPTDFVSIDFIGSSTILAEVGILEIYNAAGTLLDTYTTAGLLADAMETMSLTRLAPEIKFARAYTAEGSLPFGRLDNLSFNKYIVVPEPVPVVLVGLALISALHMRGKRTTGCMSGA